MTDNVEYYISLNKLCKSVTDLPVLLICLCVLQVLLFTEITCPKLC